MKEYNKNTEEEFTDAIGKLSKHWGLGEPAGRVWATLLFSDTALSQNDIAKKASYSLSLVSPSLSILEKLNAVRSTRGRERERRYRSNVTFTEFFHMLTKQFLQQVIKPVIDHLENSKQRRNSKLSSLNSEYRELEMYLGWFDKILSVKKSTKEKIQEMLG